MSECPAAESSIPPALRAEVDLAAIAHNVRELRRMTQPQIRFMVAVKADGYGHGAVPTAVTALENGATDLGVARVAEGMVLRRAGIRAPILIFGPTPAQCAHALIEHELTPTLFSLADARMLAAAVTAADACLPAHIKVDSGMGRLGLPCDGLGRSEAQPTAEIIRQITALPGLSVEGIYTHFATADHADKTYAVAQFKRFTALLTQLAGAGLHIPLRHAANSGAIMEMPDTHLDMVRAGISVYGLYPSDQVDRTRLRLMPAMTLKAPIIHLKHVPAGTCISYGCSFRAGRPTAIATVPVGYADGYNRRLSNAGIMLVGGHRVPVVGRVCMDLTMVDVGEVPNAKVGDEVVLMGRQGGATVTADEIATRLGTINYEVVSALTARVPRVYH